MASMRSVPRELIEDALSLLTGSVEDQRQMIQDGVKTRVIAGLAFALSTDAGFSLRDMRQYLEDRDDPLGPEPAAIGQPSGVECNGCGVELYVGEVHECPVLTLALRADPISRRSA